MADDHLSGATKLFQFCIQHPIETAIALLGLAGFLLTGVSAVEWSATPPYIRGLVPLSRLKGERLYPLAVFGGSFLALSLLRAFRRSEPVKKDPDSATTEDDTAAATPAAPYVDMSELLDQDALRAVLHTDKNHKTTIVDTKHNVTRVSVSAVVDGDGHYYGIYEREGVISARGSSQYIVVHASASGAGVRFEDLGVIAFDVQEGTPLVVKPVEQDHKCKIWRIYFRSPRRTGMGFNVRWMFTWPRSMNPRDDGDCINLRLFRNPPETVRFLAQVPAEPMLIQVGIASHLGSDNQEHWEWRDVTYRRVNPPEHLYCYGLETVVDPKTDAMFLYYRAVSGEQPVAALREMVEITPCQQSDIAEIAMLETIEEGRRGASSDQLLARLNMYPEGFLVARVGGYVVGYLQSCRFEGVPYARFEDLMPFTDKHRSSGPTLYLIFMNVARPFRNRGLASRLLQTSLLRASRDQSIREVNLISRPELVPFYQKHGFEPIRTLPNFLPRQSAILMRQALPVAPQEDLGPRPARDQKPVCSVEILAGGARRAARLR